MRKHSFTLIEIVFAVAVVALSLTAIMPLLAVGMRSTKESISDIHAAASGERFLHYMALRCRATWGELDSIPDELDFSEDSEGELHLWIELDDKGLYKNKDVYGVRQGNENIVDFRAVIRVWKSSVVSQVYSGSGWDDMEDSTYERSAGLNVELSFPAELPYDQREKRYFYMDIFRPNP